jgi:regulatory protein
MPQYKNYLPKELALLKAAKYCAYQERYQQQVRQKLFDLVVEPNDIESIIVYLIEHNYLNEERYAAAYARGKVRIKHWGLQKIKAQLKSFGITDYCIKAAISAIDKEEYYRILSIEVERKISKSKLNIAWMKERETKMYLMGRGFESDLIDEVLKSLK